MTIQQLQYFLAAVRHGSFSAAADELHLAQPSLSEQVRRLEAELGVPLFQRAGRGLLLTEAGRALQPHAERVLAEVDAARGAVLGVRELRGGTAAFGTFATSRYYLGSGLVERFLRRHPDVRVRLVGQNSAEVVEAVRAGELEAGIVVLPIDDRGLDVRPAMRDEILFATTDPGRLRGPMTIERFAERPVILPDVSFGSEDPTRRQLADLGQRAGVTLEPHIEVEDAEAAVSLAGRGLGDTIVARGVLLALGRRLPARLGWGPFDEPLYDTLAFISRRGAQLAPATRAFMAIVEERVAEVEERLKTTPPRRRKPGEAMKGGAPPAKRPGDRDAKPSGEPGATRRGGR
jgi:DNA-binding transcriptional LysR family regulator